MITNYVFGDTKLDVLGSGHESKGNEDSSFLNVGWDNGFLVRNDGMLERAPLTNLDPNKNHGVVYGFESQSSRFCVSTVCKGMRDGRARQIDGFQFLTLKVYLYRELKVREKHFLNENLHKVPLF